MVVMLPTFVLIIGILSPLCSFIPGLKPSFLQILPIVAFLFFFRTDYLDFTDCLLLLLSISVFYFSVFLFSLFSCWFHALDQADSCRLLSARENSISYRIVSYSIYHLGQTCVGSRNRAIFDGGSDPPQIRMILWKIQLGSNPDECKCGFNSLASTPLEHWGSQVERRRRENRGAVGGEGVGTGDWGGAVPLPRKFVNFFYLKMV